jgi:two-component sensor histidine kinase
MRFSFPLSFFKEREIVLSPILETSDSLGILIVKTLVEQLKGTLEISNNKGTNFIIKFPTVINFN